MSKQNNTEPLPLRLLKSFPARTWGLCDRCAEAKDEMNWDDRCILPIAAGMAVAGEVSSNPMAADGYKIAALYAWRKYKEIYTFDDDLAEMLAAQADEDLDIPIEILFQLPYPCIYIECSAYGFFVHFEHDVNNNQFELRMWYIDKKDESNNHPVILHIEEQCTIKESMKKTMDESKKNIDAGLIPENIIKSKEVEQFYNNLGLVTDYESQLSAILIQFVLFICAENSDREENPEQKKITRRTKESEEKPKDVYREIRKWDVGYRIGTTIRKVNAQNSNTEKENDELTKRNYNTGSKKSPHSRRGHWHHYWIGKRDSGDRKLILKWIAPMFINGDEDDNIATIHPVE